MQAIRLCWCMRTRGLQVLHALQWERNSTHPLGQKQQRILAVLHCCGYSPNTLSNHSPSQVKQHGSSCRRCRRGCRSWQLYVCVLNCHTLPPSRHMSFTCRMSLARHMSFTSSHASRWAGQYDGGNSENLNLLWDEDARDDTVGTQSEASNRKPQTANRKPQTANRKPQTQPPTVPHRRCRCGAEREHPKCCEACGCCFKVSLWLLR
jgi:hypothetical protein